MPKTKVTITSVDVDSRPIIFDFVENSSKNTIYPYQNAQVDMTINDKHGGLVVKLRLSLKDLDDVIKIMEASI